MESRSIFNIPEPNVGPGVDGAGKEVREQSNGGKAKEYQTAEDGKGV